MFKIFNLLTMSFNQLSKRKLRSFINIFSVSIGVVLIVTMLSLGLGIEDVLINKVSELNNLKHITINAVEYQTTEELTLALAKTTNEGDIDINNALKIKPITNEDIEKIKSKKEVDDILVKYETEVSSVSFREKKVNNVSVVSYKDNKTYLQEELRILKEKNKGIDSNINYILEGDYIKDDDSNSIMLSEFFVKNTLEITDVKDIIGQELTINSIIPNYENPLIFEEKVKVVGVIDQRFYQPSIVVSNDIMEKIKNFDKQNSISLFDRGADIVEISTKELDDVEILTNFIEKDLKYSTESVKTVAKTINNAMKFISIGLSSIGIIVISIASLGVINTMIMSIHERVRYIGLMRAVGATKFDIQRMFLTESFVIGFLGGILGILLSQISLYGIKEILIMIFNYFEIYDLEMIDNIVKLDINTSIFVVLFTALLTVISGIYPSIKASKLNPIDAIRRD